MSRPIDIAINGGGIAGLWALARLRDLGYDAHLFERDALGIGQTIAAQGIIHGGVKYALNGVFPPIASALRAMPKRWTDCVHGRGELDLTHVKVLARKHELRMQNRLFEIPLWTFDEPVLDVKSILDALQELNCEYIYRAEPVESRLTIYTAGIGNESATSETQRRPLRMFMVKPSLLGGPVYLHWVGRKQKPLMTVTTHFHKGESILYLGGSVAEKAVGMTEDQALFWAYTELQYRFPGYQWKTCQWAYHDVDRAEPKGEDLPDGPVLWTGYDRAIAWPAKMALAPVLADKIIDWVKTRDISPRRSAPLGLPHPEIAKLPWETANWKTL